MGAVSTNKYDVYYWLKKVIESCNFTKQPKQNIICKNLINNFYLLYEDISLVNNLNILLHSKN